MVITYNGTQSFKIVQGDLTIALNPVSKDSQEKSARFGANLGMVTMNHPDFNGIETITHGDKQPFLVTGPGEYEVQGVFIKGFMMPTTYGGEEKVNTIYYLTLDGMRLCFLGSINTNEITPETREALTDVDILFVPIGGGDVLEPAVAQKLVRSFGANVVIPMHYGDDKSDALKTFLKEASAEGTKPIEKLTIKRKDLEDKEADVVVLKQS